MSQGAATRCSALAQQACRSRTSVCITVTVTVCVWLAAVVTVVQHGTFLALHVHLHYILGRLVSHKESDSACTVQHKRARPALSVVAAILPASSTLCALRETSPLLLLLIELKHLEGTLYVNAALSGRLLSLHKQGNNKLHKVPHKCYHGQAPHVYGVGQLCTGPQPVEPTSQCAK